MLFEQTQSIVSRIQQILREYPYGDAVFLELLQNADDAGATSCHMNLTVPTSEVNGVGGDNQPLPVNQQTQVVTRLLASIMTAASSPPSSSTQGGGEVVQAPSEELVRAVMSQLSCAASKRPVLEFFNSSVFTEKDLNNIQNIGGSMTDSKKHDGTKVGRFGLGFNSAYHISDVIAFVSLEALVVFDPSRTFLPPHVPGQPRGGGYRWNFVSESSRLEGLLRGGKQSQLTDKDWFFLALVNMFEQSVVKSSSPGASSSSTSMPPTKFSRRTSFPGTIFRMPLRCEGSLLWREVHSVEDIAKLMIRFPTSAATLGLVLTKNVARISASITTMSYSSSSAGDTKLEPKWLYELVSTGGDDVGVKTTKQRYLKWLGDFTQVMQTVARAADEGLLTEAKSKELCKTLPAPEKHHVSVSVTFRQSAICAQSTTPTKMFAQLFSDSSSSSSPSIESSITTTVKHFSATHQFGPGGASSINNSNTSGSWQGSQVWAIAEECARYQHPISVPWSATIVENHGSLLSQQQLQQTGQGQGGSEESAATGGTLMCFFPIRTSTGLPVHIHSYFQLSSDRQSVSSVDKSRWNAALCSEVVPYSYASAVETYSTPKSLCRESTLRLWPLGVYSDDVTVEMIAAKTLGVLSKLQVFPCRGSLTSSPSGAQTTVISSADFPQEASTPFPWTTTYDVLSNIRCFAAPPSLLHPGGGSGSTTTTTADAAAKDRRIPLADVTAPAYFFLLSALPQQHQGSRLLYIPSEHEYQTLAPDVVSAFRRRGMQTLSVDPAYLRSSLSQSFREALVPTTASSSATTQAAGKPTTSPSPMLRAFQSIPSHIAIVLLCACLRDGALEEFVALCDKNEVPPLIPLATGFGGLLRKPRSSSSSSSRLGNSNIALMASEQSWYELAEGLVPLRERLIVFLGEEQQQTHPQSASHDDINANKKISDIVFLHGNNDTTNAVAHTLRSCGVPRHIVDAARRYFVHLQYTDVVEVLDATTFPNVLGGLLTASSITTFIQRNQQPQQSKEDGHHWEMELGSHKIPSAAVKKLLDCVTSSLQPTPEFFKLPILPAIMPLGSSSNKGDEGPQEIRRFCVSAADGVCIAIPSATTASISSSATKTSTRAIAALRDVLVWLGATQIDTGIFPEAVIRQWSDGSSNIAEIQQKDGKLRLSRIATLEDTKQGARCAISALRVLLQGRPVATLLASSSIDGRVSPLHESCGDKEVSDDSQPSSSSDCTRADVIRSFFARFRQELTQADTQFLSTLPIFRTIWGTYVTLRDDGTAAAAPTIVPASVFLLPAGLPPIAERALRQGPFLFSQLASTTMGPNNVVVLPQLPSQQLLRVLDECSIIDRYHSSSSSSVNKTNSLHNDDDNNSSNDGAALAATFALEELPYEVAMAIAGTRIAPLKCLDDEAVPMTLVSSTPPSAATCPSDAALDPTLRLHEVKAFWTLLFEALFQHHQSSTTTGGGGVRSANKSASSMNKYLKTALQVLSSWPIFPKAATTQKTPSSVRLSDVKGLLLLNGSGNTLSALFATHTAPSTVVDQQDLPAALSELLTRLQCSPQSNNDGAKISDVAMIDPFLAASSQHRKSVFAQLNVKDRVDGDALVQLVNATSDLLIRKPLEVDAKSNISSNNIALTYVSAILQQLEASTDLSEAQWEQLGRLPLIPVAPSESDARDTEATSSQVLLMFSPLSRVCWQHVYRLCPTGRRSCIHQGLAGILSPSSSTKSSSTNNLSSSLLKLSDRFLWNTPPPMKDVLTFVEQTGKRFDAATLFPSSITTTGAIDVRDWSVVLDHVEQQLRVSLDRNRQSSSSAGSQGGSFPLIPSAATTGLTDFVDPLLLSREGREFMELLKASFQRVYFPEATGGRKQREGEGVAPKPTTGASFALSQLAFDTKAEACFPFLAAVDKASAARYPALWSVLGVPQKHSFQELSHVLDAIINQAAHDEDAHADRATTATHVDPNAAETTTPSRTKRKVGGSLVGTRLSDELRTAYANVLIYIALSYPVEARERCKTAKNLLVPTADGLVNWGHLVNYNVASSAATDETLLDPHTLLHTAVRTDIAKTLGLTHTGIQLVAQMHARHARGGAAAAFRAKGQRQSVVNAIKRILGDYSDQQSVLMEMLQNADDAGATTVTFTLDHRRHSTESVEELLGKEMIRCLGPSLVVTNDKLFMPTDFDALFEIGCGHKTRDPTSIGRFGVGFNSVYHVTDCPSIVSGDCTLFLDPSTAHLDSATPEAPGVMINHVKEPTLAAMFPAQLAPYRRFGVDFSKRYNGTLFRLPLRLEPWEHSMTPNAWTVVDMRRVFQNFLTFMPHVLLFMRNVEEVRFTEVSHVEGNSYGREELLQSVRLRDTSSSSSSVESSVTEGLREYRNQLASFAATLHPEKPIRTPLHAFCVVDAVVEAPAQRNHKPQLIYSWLLSTNIRSIASGPELPNCNSELRRKLIPWGSVAVFLRDNTTHSQMMIPAITENANDGDSELSESVCGVQRHLNRLGKTLTRAAQSMVHCYLPLPSLKGELPFHIHGCFALTSDRRGMWTQSLTDDASWEVTWNRYILNELIADAALHALRCHPPLLMPTSSSSSQQQQRKSSVDSQSILAEYYNVFPAIAGSGGQTAAGDNSGDASHSGGVIVTSSSTASTTEVFRNLRLGFFTLLYRDSIPLLWSTQGFFVEAQRACCAPFRLRSAVAAGGASALLTASSSRAPAVNNGGNTTSGAGGGGSASAGIPSSLLPYQLSEGLAEHVLVDEKLCYMPQELFHCLIEAAEELSIEPPSELNPRKIAKELYLRAGSSQGISVVYASLLATSSAPPVAEQQTPHAVAQPTAHTTHPLEQRRSSSKSFFGRFVSSLSGTSSASSDGMRASNSNNSGGDHLADDISAFSPPFVVMAELTLYLTQLNDPTLLQDVPLVLLRDGTVGIVGKVAAQATVSSANNTTGAATGQSTHHSSTSAVFISPTFAREVEELFPSVPVVDDRYFQAVVSMSSKKAQQQQQQLNSRGQSAAAGQQQQQQLSLLVDAFSQDRWSLLLGVEALQVKTIYRLFHLHAAAQTGVEFNLGHAYPLDRTFLGSNSALRRWCIAFWHFVHKSDSTVRFDQAFLQPQNCGDLAEWPLIPAKRAGEHVLIPMKECDLLVSGSTSTFVNEALEHLGVWVLDSDFDQWTTIRIKCGVVEVEGQKIGDLLENAVGQGRFQRMPNEHRQRMLEWLLQCNRNQRGFFNSMLGGTGPLADSIKRLPLFPMYDANVRDWVYSPMMAQATAGQQQQQLRQNHNNVSSAPAALPRGIPLSPLCHGMFQAPIPELDLNEFPIKNFILSRVCPALVRLESPVFSSSASTASTATALASSGRNGSTIPLTLEEELSYWALVGKHLDEQIVSHLSGSAIIPRQHSRAEVRELRIERRVNAALEDTSISASTIPSLKVLAAEWIADSYYASSSSSSASAKTMPDIFAAAKLDTKNPALHALIRTARMDYLDRRKRYTPSSIVRPVVCIGAPFPNILSTLMEFMPASFTKIVCPSFLWDDAAMQQLLLKLGVSFQLDRVVLREATEAFALMIRSGNDSTGNSRRDAAAATQRLHSFLDATEAQQQHHQQQQQQQQPSMLQQSIALRQPAHLIRVDKTTAQKRQQHLRELSWSIALCVVNLANDRELAIETVQSLDFLAPHPLTYLPSIIGSTTNNEKVSSNIRLVAPNECVGYSYRFVAWLERPIAPLALSGSLVRGKPSVDQITSQLFSIVGLHPIIALSPRMLNKVLSNTYLTLSSEYRSDLSPSAWASIQAGERQAETTALAGAERRTRQAFDILHKSAVFIVPVSPEQNDTYHHRHLYTSPAGGSQRPADHVKIDNLTAESIDEWDDEVYDGNAGSTLLSTYRPSYPNVCATCDFVQVHEDGVATITTKATSSSMADALLLPTLAAYPNSRFTISRAALSQVINVTSAARIGSLRPHFYHLHEFEVCPSLVSLLQLASASRAVTREVDEQIDSNVDVHAAQHQRAGRINGRFDDAVGVPSVELILQAIDTYSSDTTPLSTQRLHTYVELLKLLVHAAEYYRLQLSSTAAPPQLSTRASTAAAATTSTSRVIGERQRHVPTAVAPPVSRLHHQNIISTAAVRIPDQTGTLRFLSQGLAIPDQASLLRRIIPGSVLLVHPIVLPSTAKALGCPSIGQVLREEPRGGHLTPAAMALRRREQQQRRSSGGAAAATASTTAAEQQLQEVSARYHMFFSSPVCCRVVQRLLLTALFHAPHDQRPSGGGGGQPKQHGGRGGGDSLNAQELHALRTLRVEFVPSILLHISHKMCPDDNIANGTESPPYALSVAASTVFVVDSRLDDGSASSCGAMSSVSAPHNYLVAMSVNRLLRNRLSAVLAPLSCVLEFVTRGPAPVGMLPFMTRSRQAPPTTAVTSRGTNAALTSSSTSEAMTGAIHKLLDTFDCVDIVASVMNSAAPQAQLPLQVLPASVQGGGNSQQPLVSAGSTVLARYELQLGRLLNVPSTADGGSNLIVAEHTVDDYWLLKYAVSDVARPGGNKKNLRQATVDKTALPQLSAPTKSSSGWEDDDVDFLGPLSLKPSTRGGADDDDYDAFQLPWNFSLLHDSLPSPLLRPEFPYGIAHEDDEDADGLFVWTSMSDQSLQKKRSTSGESSVSRVHFR